MASHDFTTPASSSPESVAPVGPADSDSLRLEALAQAAGGLAPTLNDLFTVIRGHAGGLLDAAEQDARTSESLNQIYTAAEKAASVLRQLLIFSRCAVPQLVPLDLNRFIEETMPVLRRLLGAGVSLEFRPAPGRLVVVADAGMIEQGLIVLALNARDAMPDGGRFLLATEFVETAAAAATGEPGKFAVVRATDTGTGLTPEILPHLFEPFFTTKAPGRGRGLGLATVFGIAQLHRGSVTAGNAPDAGATFSVFLPVAPPDALAEPAADAGARDGHETILLVEDDPAVREFTAALLAQHGYRVLQAASGPEALEVWQWHGARVRLLLTDMVLEDDLTGLELAAKLRAENPGLKVICTSGHSREALERFPELSGGGYEFLEKPCRPQRLLATVRTLLDATPL